jgi:hypothetical protein
MPRRARPGKARGASTAGGRPRVPPPRNPPPRISLPRISKGGRPEFYEDPAIDQLFAIVTALTGEISVLFDRVDTLQRVLTDARVVQPRAIETFTPDPAAAAVRAERRDELLRRVFAVLEAYAARKQSPAP